MASIPSCAATRRADDQRHGYDAGPTRPHGFSSARRREIPFNAASSDHATPAFNLMALFVNKLWLIYRNPTAVLDQRRQSRDTLGHPAGNGQDEIPQTRYVVQARPDRLGQPENAAPKRQRNRVIQPCGLSLRPHEGEGVLQPMREFTTDHEKTLGPRKPDRRRSDCPDLMLFCSRRIPAAILNSARD